jgi:hypothetical protein
MDTRLQRLVVPEGLGQEGHRLFFSKARGESFRFVVCRTTLADRLETKRQRLPGSSYVGVLFAAGDGPKRHQCRQAMFHYCVHYIHTYIRYAFGSGPGHLHETFLSGMCASEDVLTQTRFWFPWASDIQKAILRYLYWELIVQNRQCSPNSQLLSP